MLDAGQRRPRPASHRGHRRQDVHADSQRAQHRFRHPHQGRRDGAGSEDLPRRRGFAGQTGRGSRLCAGPARFLRAVGHLQRAGRHQAGEVPAARAGRQRGHRRDRRLRSLSLGSRRDEQSLSRTGSVRARPLGARHLPRRGGRSCLRLPQACDEGAALQAEGKRLAEVRLLEGVSRFHAQPGFWDAQYAKVQEYNQKICAAATSAAADDSEPPVCSSSR